MRFWACLFACAISLTAADSAGPSLRSESPMVLIHATVLDRTGRTVMGLPASSFEVRDEKQPVSVSHFVLEDTPVSTVVVVDVSRSMRFDFDLTLRALHRFLDSAQAGDEFCIIPFAGTAPPDCAFTEHSSSVDFTRVPQGDTALLDALTFAFRKAGQAHNQRRAVLVLTDAVDNASRTTWSQARSAAREFDGTLYAVAPPLVDAESLGDEQRLQSLTELTGGRMFRLRRMADLAPTLDSLDLRRQYVFGYGVPESGRDGRYHNVSIRLRPGSDSENLRVYWRRGYRAPAK